VSTARFFFSDIVVISGKFIGCVVKTWGPSIRRGRHYEVYVRSINAIQDYDEDLLQRYIVSKELSVEEQRFHENQT
jgi:hypothetical protein